MKKYIALVISCFILFVYVLPAVGSLGSDAESGKVIVEIDYGKKLPAKTFEVVLSKGQTVLGVLQNVAVVETHPVGPYVIVAAIDGVDGKRGETAWYYTVDGVSADKLAAANVIDKAVHIAWKYQEDVCSRKVDR